jgi:hypothetical protein
MYSYTFCIVSESCVSESWRTGTADITICWSKILNILHSIKFFYRGVNRQTFFVSSKNKVGFDSSSASIEINHQMLSKSHRPPKEAFSVKYLKLGVSCEPVGVIFEFLYIWIDLFEYSWWLLSQTFPVFLCEMVSSD